MRLFILNIVFFMITFTSLNVNSQFVISSGSGITILEGTSLYIDTTLYIKSDVSGSGHLADQNATGDMTITGDVTVETYLTQDGWHNISAPLNNLSSNDIPGTDLIFYYDETIILNDWNFGWVWYEGPFSVMRGYDVFLDSSITANYFSSISANLNTGTYSFGVTLTDVANGEVENRKGWNLLGNPYPSPVDWLQESGWDKADINDAKYIWNPDNNNYTIYLGGVSPTGVNGGTQYIPSSQGFWVQAVQNGSVSIGNSTRVGVADGTPSFYKSNLYETRISVSGNGYEDEALVRFLSKSSYSFDKDMDATKLFTRHDSVPQIYSRIGTSLMAINSIPESNEPLAISLDFRCGTSGVFSLKIDSDMDKVFLFDNFNENYYEVEDQHNIEFLYNTSYSDSRFVLYFNASRSYMENLSPDPYSIHYDGISLIVKQNFSDDRTGILNIYSFSGQLLKSYNIAQGNTTIPTDLNHGWYIASILIGNKQYNYKVGIF